MSHATRESLTNEIYFDENARNLNAEAKRYEAAKLRYAEFKEQEMLEEAWQRSEKRREKLEKIIQNIKQIITKAEQKQR